MTQKIMIRCPIPTIPTEIGGGFQVGTTKMIPITMCAIMDNGKPCQCININPLRAASETFDKNNITPEDYIVTDGVNIFGVDCGYPQLIPAVVVEFPDNKPLIVRAQ